MISNKFLPHYFICRLSICRKTAPDTVQWVFRHTRGGGLRGIMKYTHFNVSIYCPVSNLIAITDFEDFDRKFTQFLQKVKIGKVYLETYRNGKKIDRDHLLKLKEYFVAKGIQVSGGITTDDVHDSKEGGFSPLCYTSARAKLLLKEVVTLTAEVFDEFILDDFYFTNCRCDDCIEAKGELSWAQFRLNLMKDISENIIIKTAREVNPQVKAIIKFPNWYEHYQDSGYNLEDEPVIFDYIYTGTETRNPMYTQQHLPKYLSYFVLRYLEQVAPDRNLGGWFDPFECSYNLTSYMEQAYLTLFAKAKEVMLFCLGALLNDKSYSTFSPAVGQAFEDMDLYIGSLGNPVGVACYLPYHSYGEDYLHNYIGMCGIPLEPYPEYPLHAKTILLTESAAHDTDILNKIKKSLADGADLIVTSGFLKKLGPAFHELAHVAYTDGKLLASRYMYSKDGGITMNGSLESSHSILLPSLHYFTNDVWELAAAYGEDNNIPVILKTKYSKGRLFIVTIPDDLGNLYHYPVPVLNVLRNILCSELPVILESDSKVALFTYDNDTFILRSFLPYSVELSFLINRKSAILTDLENGKKTAGSPAANGTRFTMTIAPGVNQVFHITAN